MTEPALRAWPVHEYLVGAEAIRRYADAVGETDPIHFDGAAARDAGFRDVVAPPMFAVVYLAAAVQRAFHDPELAIDFDRLLHIGQEFAWEEPVLAGDVVTARVSLVEDRTHDGQRFCRFTSIAANQGERVVVRGDCRTIIRGR
jgi:acyl dehydratase